jgi:hypothetical protein
VEIIGDELALEIRGINNQAEKGKDPEEPD